MRAATLRWLICALLFLATVISYIDRQTLSIAAPAIVKEFSLDNRQLGAIISAFLITYTFGQLFAGGFFDWFGTRRAFALCMAVWSSANALTAFVTRPFGIGAFRFLLGAGEAGNFPGGVKVVAEWFPAAERPLANGIFTSGASLGAILAGPLVGTITHFWGWRAAFLVTGALGFVWLAAWLMLYDAPHRHRMLAREERAPFAEMRQRLFPDASFRWIDLLRTRQVWAITLARFFEEPLIWLAVFWLPKYIVDVRQLTVLETGWLLTLPFIALDLGYVGGGYASSRMIKRGSDGRRAKLQVMAVSAVLMTCAIPAALSGSVAPFIGFLCAATFGHGAWFSNLMSLPADIAPPNLVASLYGITALGGGISGLLFTQFTGLVADTFRSYTPVFVLAGLLPGLALAVLALPRGALAPLSVAARAAGAAIVNGGDARCTDERS